MKLATALVIGILAVAKVQAQEAKLSVAPAKCVALQKGQVCYQTIRVYLKMSIKSDFCLLVDDQTEPLQCWNNSEKAEFNYQLASTRTVEFSMIDSSSETLASAFVNVSWVYKNSRKRNRWRLF